MNVKNIKVDQIKVLENIRTRIELKDLASLMESIKQHGLLHPIGVWKEGKDYILAWGRRRLEAHKKLDYNEIPAAILPDKLTEKDFIVLNATENIHRLDISPLELGKNCRRLKEMDLSISEIAARLSFPISKIRTAMRLYRNVPKEYEHMIGYKDKYRAKAGKIAAVTADRILSLRITKANREKVLIYARKEDMTLQELVLLEVLLRSGASVTEALGKLTNYVNKNLKLSVNKKEFEKIKGQFTNYLVDIIEGKRKPHPGLIFWKEK